MATAGVAPRIMGIGPAPATKKVLVRTSLTLEQIDVIGLNESFAAKGLAVLRMLEVKGGERVNACGGAIALRHPLGVSGARPATKAMTRLTETGERYVLCTICIGACERMPVGSRAGVNKKAPTL